MTYAGDRPDVRDAIDQLEAIVRDVAEELAGWRSRAQKAEAELKVRGSPVKNADLESENKLLRNENEDLKAKCDTMESSKELMMKEIPDFEKMKLRIKVDAKLAADNLEETRKLYEEEYEVKKEALMKEVENKEKEVMTV